VPTKRQINYLHSNSFLLYYHNWIPLIGRYRYSQIGHQVQKVVQYWTAHQVLNSCWCCWLSGHLFGSTRTLKMPVINMTGDQSPHADATVVFNGRLQPHRCTWMKIQDAAMILEEQPAKVAEAVNLFLQGLGYTLRRVGQGRCSTIYK
jgi:hypothetical protein